MLAGCTPYPAEFVERYVRAGHWRAETIAQAVAAAAASAGALDPTRVAIADPDRRLSFGDLLAEASRFAGVLAQHGLRSSDPVIIQLPNCAEFASLLLACLEIGVLPIMALPAYRRAELEYLVSFTGARALALAPEYRDFDHAALARDLKRSQRSLEAIFSTASADGCISLHKSSGEPREIGARSGDPCDAALFLLSGGTTGLPKLIPRTHADYLYNARAAAAACGLDQTSRVLLALPAGHNFPLSSPGLLGALLTGATAVYAQSAQAAELAAIIERERITHLPCVPTFAMSLLEVPGAARMLESLRVITVGGQRLQEPTARALRRAFPWLKVQQVFGMAEGLVCYTSLDDPDEVALTMQGRPLSPDDELRIVDPAGCDVATGEVGELWCRGPYTIRGYFRAPERNREAFTSDGFYRTGDLVRRHPSGNLLVEGRIKDVINRGGEKISAEEVEAHLLAHPDVAAAAVVAMPDAALGERACAYVTLHDGANVDLERLRVFLASRSIARFKWPERLEVLDHLPLTNVGKIKKAELRLDIERKLDAERRAGTDNRSV
jgi:2,3-dihydroxybenzoate---[aryl-carrier protein] ligase